MKDQIACSIHCDLELHIHLRYISCHRCQKSQSFVPLCMSTSRIYQIFKLAIAASFALRMSSSRIYERFKVAIAAKLCTKSTKDSKSQ